MTEADKDVLRSHQRTMAKRATDFAQQAKWESTDPDTRIECRAGAVYSQSVADALGAILRENEELVRLAASMSDADQSIIKAINRVVADHVGRFGDSWRMLPAVDDGPDAE